MQGSTGRRVEQSCRPWRHPADEMDEVKMMRAWTEIHVRPIDGRHEPAWPWCRVPWSMWTDPFLDYRISTPAKRAKCLRNDDAAIE